MRELIHERNINSKAWRHDDGSWEIETRLVDVKGYDTVIGMDKPLKKGEALHDMIIVLKVGKDLQILDIELGMPHTPFPVCPGVIKNFQSLRGESMGKGWNKLLTERFSAEQGCRHLVDLLRGTATVLFQARSYERKSSPKDFEHWADSCHAFRQDGEVIRFFQQKKTGDKYSY